MTPTTIQDGLWAAAEDAVYRYLEAFDPDEKLAMEDYAASVLDSLVEASRKVEGDA